MKSLVSVFVALAVASAPLSALADQVASVAPSNNPPATPPASLPPPPPLQTAPLPPVAIAGPVAPQPYVPGVQYQRRSRVGLQVGGSIVFGVFYGFGLLFAIAASIGTAPLPADRFLAIPVAGPFIVACDLNLGDGDRVWILVDGVFQLLGAAGLVLGTLFTRQVPVIEMGRRRAPTWGIVPSAPGAPIGASMVATF